MAKRVVQHRAPSRCVEESHMNRVLNESGNTGCMSGSDQFADRLKLFVLQGHSDLGGRHTKIHTISGGTYFLAASKASA